MMSIRKLRKYEPFIHLAFWSLIFFFPYIKYFARDGGYPMSLGHEFNALLFYLIPTYVTYLWFLPLENKRNYIWLMILLFLANSFLFDFFDGLFHLHENHNYFEWKRFTSSIATSLTYSIVFFALYSVKKLYLKQEKLDAVFKEKEKAKYEGLKAQVNPHFLFNTLNTIYASALKTDETTAELILKLSDNFRYLFHEGQKEKVFLADEIRHLKNYIDLQKERLKNKVKVRINLDVEDENVMIAPLLLIPFVENAFKYSSMLRGGGHDIEISIVVKENLLVFCCNNPYLAPDQEQLDPGWRDSGIGINNTRERLNYLYSEKHTLDITEDNNLFEILLKIVL